MPLWPDGLGCVKTHDRLLSRTAAVSLDSREAICTVAYCIGCEYATVCMCVAVPAAVTARDLGFCGAGRGCWRLRPGSCSPNAMFVPGFLACAVAQAVHRRRAGITKAVREREVGANHGGSVL